MYLFLSVLFYVPKYFNNLHCCQHCLILIISFFEKDIVVDVAFLKLLLCVVGSTFNRFLIAAQNVFGLV